MTIDQAMAKVVVVIDDMIANAMDEGIRMIADRGASEEEIESFCEWYGAQLADDRDAKLAALRDWLRRDGATLQ